MRNSLISHHCQSDGFHSINSHSGIVQAPLNCVFVHLVSCRDDLQQEPMEVEHAQSAWSGPEYQSYV